MALFHLSVKPITRSSGRAATAAAAYRAACRIHDERTGALHDYSRKQGVLHTEIIAPEAAPAWTKNREALWNAAEQVERRKDACVAREYEVALPHELPSEQRIALAREFGKQLCDVHGCVVDIAIHKPNRDGDQRNYHAHILTTTRKIEPDGFGAKCDRELSDTDRKKKGLPGRTADLEATRASWASLQNSYLARHAPTARAVDHRSLAAQRASATDRERAASAAKLERQPSRHMGPHATAMERRGIRTRVGDMNRSIRAAYELGVLERAAKKLDARIIDTETSLEHVLKERGHAAAERKDDMKAVGKFIADTADLIGKTAGGVLIESIGGSAAAPHQPSFRIEQPPGPDYAKDRERLENSTGKPHYYVSGQVEGRLLGKANLGGEAFARISHQQGKAVALVPWREEMTRHIGKDLTISHDKGRDMTIQVGGGRDLGRSL